MLAGIYMFTIYQHKFWRINAFFNPSSSLSLYREFASVCNAALELNSRLVDAEQFQYHESLVTNFNKMKEKLQDILSEQVGWCFDYLTAFTLLPVVEYVFPIHKIYSPAQIPANIATCL